MKTYPLLNAFYEQYGSFGYNSDTTNIAIQGIPRGVGLSWFTWSDERKEDHLRELWKLGRWSPHKPTNIVYYPCNGRCGGLVSVDRDDLMCYAEMMNKENDMLTSFVFSIPHRDHYHREKIVLDWAVDDFVDELIPCRPEREYWVDWFRYE